MTEKLGIYKGDKAKNKNEFVSQNKT